MPFGQLLTVLGYIVQIGFVGTLSQLLCELRLQLKLGSGCSLVKSGRVACAAGCSMTIDIVNLEGKLLLHSPADSSCIGKFEGVPLTCVCM